MGILHFGTLIVLIFDSVLDVFCEISGFETFEKFILSRISKDVSIVQPVGRPPYKGYSPISGRFKAIKSQKKKFKILEKKRKTYST